MGLILTGASTTARSDAEVPHAIELRLSPLDELVIINDEGEASVDLGTVGKVILEQGGIEGVAVDQGDTKELVTLILVLLEVQTEMQVVERLRG